MTNDLNSQVQRFRPVITIGEIERLIKKHRLILPCPCRATFVNMCEDGTFETAPAVMRKDMTSEGVLYISGFVSGLAG